VIRYQGVRGWLTKTSPSQTAPVDNFPKPPRVPRKRTLQQPAPLTRRKQQKGQEPLGFAGALLLRLSPPPSWGLVKTVLIWAAPTVTITLSALWLLVALENAERYENARARSFPGSPEGHRRGPVESKTTPEKRVAFDRNGSKLDELIIEKRMAKVTPLCGLGDSAFPLPQTFPSRFAPTKRSTAPSGHFSL